LSVAATPWRRPVRGARSSRNRKAGELAAVLLGEYGSAAEEEEILRRYRHGGVPGVPVLLIGGQNAVRRTHRFREAGADMIFAATFRGR